LSGGLWILFYSALALAIFYFAWPELVQRVMGVSIEDQSAWTPVARGLGLLFVVGVVKGYVVHGLLLRLRMYGAYLATTLATLAVAVAIGTAAESWTAVTATIVRLTPDVLFVAITLALWVVVRRREAEPEA
jgi:hypothetical protein